MRSLLLFLFVMLSFLPSTVRALGIITPFGGTINSVSICTCIVSPALVLRIKLIGSIRPVNLVWQPPFITTAYQWYVPYPKLYTVGSYIKGGICLMQAYPTCTKSSQNITGTIIRIGTGLLPSK